MPAFEELISRTAGSRSKCLIGDIQVEASVTQTHDLKAKITDHPVEKGINITDNYRPKGRELKIDGIISNTPIIPVIPLVTTIDAVKNLADGNAKPVDEMWERFKEMFKNSEIIQIKTSLDTYDNMAIESLSVTRENSVGDALQFTMMAKEVRIVITEYGDKLTVAKKPGGQKKKKKGQQTKPPASKEQLGSTPLRHYQAGGGDNFFSTAIEKFATWITGGGG
ncbi:MAG: hypothetical protein JRD89_09225 [Deltaproteobacteria bacterium]|nr:hypothetical protein [Deltaproteobacteria bacterium]